jgi:peptide/nickel transport system permease protein
MAADLLPNPKPERGIAPPTLSMAALRWRRFQRHHMAMAGATIILLLILAAIFAPLITSVDPAKQALLLRVKPPSAAHWFGTDPYGRDVFTRLIYGTRISLKVGFVSVMISMAVGVTLGSLAGYFGGWWDSIIMRVTDVFLSIPVFFLIIAVIAMFRPSEYNIIAVLGFTSWPGLARLVRGEFLSLRERDFVEAARATGARDMRIVFRHVLPNALGPIIVAATLRIAGAILTESSLSYLGLGIQPPTASWGNMLQEGQPYLLVVPPAWWMAVFPGAAIFLTVMAFNAVGDGLRDALDPRMKH